MDMEAGCTPPYGLTIGETPERLADIAATPIACGVSGEAVPTPVIRHAIRIRPGRHQALPVITLATVTAELRFRL